MLTVIPGRRSGTKAYITSITSALRLSQGQFEAQSLSRMAPGLPKQPQTCSPEPGPFTGSCETRTCRSFLQKPPSALS